MKQKLCIRCAPLSFLHTPASYRKLLSCSHPLVPLGTSLRLASLPCMWSACANQASLALAFLEPHRSSEKKGRKDSHKKEPLRRVLSYTTRFAPLYVFDFSNQASLALAFLESHQCISLPLVPPKGRFCEFKR